MMLTTLIGAALLAIGPTPTTDVRPAADIIEIRAGMFDNADAPRRDQIRYSNETRGEVVAEMDQNGNVQWSGASDRAALGGQDAAAMIYVRVFDAVFAIDPFVEMPKGDIAASRVLFTGSSLETNRALFDRRRIERTEELFERLEHARRAWLRDNGFYNARTITRSGAEAPSTSTSSIEPIMKIERPADMPRGRSLEQVDASPTLRLDSDQPIRISMPHGTAPDVIAEAEHVIAASESASEPSDDEKSEEIASR